MNPTVNPTMGFSPYQPYTATPYSPNAIVPSSSVLDSIRNSVNQGQSAVGNTGSTNAQSAAAANKPKESLLQRLLPTAGAIGGGVLGELVDPFGGGIAGAALGAGLAGAGAAGGKAVENATSGQNVGSGLLTSGLEGAAGQGIGAGVGTLLGKGGSILSDIGANKAASTEAQNATQGALDEATRVGNEFGAVKPGQAQVGPALDKLRSLGIANPTAEDAANVGSTYTGSNQETGTGVLNFYKQQALDQAGGKVDLGGTMDNLHSTLSEPGTSMELGSTEPISSAKGQLPKAPNNAATKIVQQVRNMLPDGTLDENGQIAEQVSPQDGFSLLKSIGSKINDTTPKVNVNTGQVDPAQLAENNVWKSVYSSVKDALYNRPEVDSAVQGLRVGPDESSVIDDAIKSNGITDPGVAANIKSDLSNTLNNANTAQDLLGSEAPMVNVSKVGNIAKNFTENNPQVAKGTAAVKSQINNQGNFADKALGLGLNLGGAYEGVIGGHPAAMLPALAFDAAKNPQVLQGAGSLLGKIGSSALPTAGAQVIANSPNDVASPTQGSTIGTNMQDPLQNTLLSQVLNQDLTAGREALVDPYLANNFSTQISQLPGLVGNAQKISQAQAALGGAANEFNQAGGAQGPIGGLLSRLGATFTGGPASQYGSQSRQAAQAIAAATGIPAEQVEAAMPQVTQNQQSSEAALQNITNLISALGGGQPQNSSVLSGL